MTQNELDVAVQAACLKRVTTRFGLETRNAIGEIAVAPIKGQGAPVRVTETWVHLRDPSCDEHYESEMMPKWE